MAYIGKPPSSVFSAAAKYDSFTGDGSTVAFDLANIVPAGGQNGLQVYVDNVRQEPGASNAYTLGNDASGDLKRITFTAAPDNGAEIYVITPYEATNIKNVGDGTITTAKLDDGAITNAKVNACAAIADTKLAQITTASKVATSAISQPGSSGVYLSGDGSWGAIDTSQQDTNANNISLLGFKMAVNEGLTVFNLVDGVVDEFNDESGTDESEGSNDNYCGTSDFYANRNPVSGPAPATSAGFSTTAITEPDTSTAGTNPAYGCGSYGTFTVPTGVTSLNISAWGAGGGTSGPQPAGPFYGIGGGGGYVAGTLAVTPGQAFTVVVGEGGSAYGAPDAIVRKRALGGGGSISPSPAVCQGYAGGGGLSGFFAPGISINQSLTCHSGSPVPACGPKTYMVAGSGGGGGQANGCSPVSGGYGGNGGGLTGDAGGTNPAGALEQTNRGSFVESGGGGDQEQGGQGGDSPTPAGCGGIGNTGAFLLGGSAAAIALNGGGGGAGYFGGGGSSGGGSPGSFGRVGGGGSSYYGHPQVTCGSTEEGNNCESGGVAIPTYVCGTGEAPTSLKTYGEDGYVLLTAAAVCASTTSTTIVSTAFNATSVPTTSRIVVFEENVDTPTLNTDIIASISRDGGATYTNATLSDSGYVTGSSGQRILTGQATISGQPSGQSMRWKLALANNTVKIHGVSLQWA